MVRASRQAKGGMKGHHGEGGKASKGQPEQGLSSGNRHANVGEEKQQAASRSRTVKAAQKRPACLGKGALQLVCMQRILPNHFFQSMRV
eukprot:365562-Chlamydomonas_euryale.AAC.4